MGGSEVMQGCPALVLINLLLQTDLVNIEEYRERLLFYNCLINFVHKLVIV